MSKFATQYRFTVVLPFFDNEGIPQHHKVTAIRNEIIALTGGVSTTVIDGVWRDENGREYVDSSLQVTTLTSREKTEVLFDRASFWCVDLKQECLLITREQIECCFVEPVIQQAEIA